ncbi:hypothetical protein X733_01745 [Mesorhizobium sp. L2C067A000]|nr:hypothetical protein X733_01745 [Mesorhizobium sp. L2C067A000]
MVSNPVSRIEDALDDGRMSGHLFSNHEERSLDPMKVEHLQDLLGMTGLRTIVERKPDALRQFPGVTLPGVKR